MKSLRSFRLLTALFAALLAAVAYALPASAAAPKFFSANSSVNSAGALVVSFDERGLGNGNIDYSLSADSTAVYACINGGGHNPSASNKRTVNGETTAQGSFESKNGRVQASLTAGPISAGSFSCPSGQRLVLASVSYTNIVLTDTTNEVTTNVADASRTFFTV